MQGMVCVGQLHMKPALYRTNVYDYYFTCFIYVKQMCIITILPSECSIFTPAYVCCINSASYNNNADGQYDRLYTYQNPCALLLVHRNLSQLVGHCGSASTSSKFEGRCSRLLDATWSSLVLTSLTGWLLQLW